MKERPILFSTPMVQAILEGRKTQTRRVFRFSKKARSYGMTEAQTHACWSAASPAADGSWIMWYPGKRTPAMDEFTKKAYPSGGYVCPYGIPGDRLWVREDIRRNYGQIRPDTCTYIADDTPVTGISQTMYCGQSVWQWPNIKKLPAIFMPRWASRITLEIVSVRPERVQEISDEDAIQEGIEYEVIDQAITMRDYSRKDAWFQNWSDDIPDYIPTDQIFRASVRTLWDKINGPRGFPWAMDPWIWRIEFKRLEAA